MVTTDLRVTVAVPNLGEPSQPWIYRQLDQMDCVELQVIHWGVKDNADGLSQRFDCVRLQGHIKPIIRKDKGRWVQRLVNTFDGNYFAADRTSVDSISQVIEAHRPDVLLAHFAHTALTLLPVAERNGTAMVAHFHGGDLSESLTRNRWYRWSLKQSLHRFHSCIVVGTHQRDQLVELGMPDERVHLVPCGVPIDQFQPASPRNGVPFRFVIVARLIKSKGVDISIRAFARMLERWPDAELVIAGDGPMRAELEALAETLSIGNKLRFLGMISERQVAGMLGRSDALLHHSIERYDWVEGFGVAVAEGAATGLPVVVSRSGGLVDQVVDGVTGYIVPVGDETAMADAMLKLSSNREHSREIGAAGRQRMIDEFDSQNMSTRLRAILAEAAHRPMQVRQRQRFQS